jgi:lipid A 4'-phosphatase
MKGPLVFLAVSIGAAILFTAAPGIDLWTSSLFWSPDGGFFLRDWPPFRLAYVGLPTITWAVALGLAGLLALTIVGESAIGRLDRKMVLFLLATMIVGPGLLANTVLKDHWGRARPAQITEFGGTKSFTPALVPSDQCDRNCSFVSGHGAMAFALVAFSAVPATLRRRRWTALATLGFGGFVGLARIAQGGHFLSDTIFAGLLMVAVAWLLYRWIVVADGLAHPVFRRIAALLAGIGAALWRFLDRASPGSWRRWAAFTFLCLAGIAVSIAWLDRPIARYFHAPDDRLTAFFVWFAHFGMGWPLYLSGAAVLILLALARAPRFAATKERFTAWALAPLFIFTSVALAGLLADLVKILVGRTRPKLFFSDGLFTWGGPVWQADHWSLPSGHTVNAVALATALFLLWPRHLAAYALFAALIALCRIGADQHYLSDTIASLWIAVPVTFYVRGIYRRSGIRLEDATSGVIPPLPPVSWWRRLSPFHRHSL